MKNIVYFALIDVSLISVGRLIRGTPGTGGFTKFDVMYDPFELSGLPASNSSIDDDDELVASSSESSVTSSKNGNNR